MKIGQPDWINSLGATTITAHTPEKMYTNYRSPLFYSFVARTDLVWTPQILTRACVNNIIDARTRCRSLCVHTLRFFFLLLSSCKMCVWLFSCAVFIRLDKTFFLLDVCKKNFLLGVTRISSCKMLAGLSSC